jgi:hypothetical protein
MRHDTSPHTGRIQYLGAHAETARNLRSMLTPFLKDMEDLEKNGVDVQCVGKAHKCNACRDKVPIFKGPNGEDMHHFSHTTTISADMLWMRLVQGVATNVCPYCGFNSSETHEAGDLGLGLEPASIFLRSLGLDVSFRDGNY